MKNGGKVMFSIILSALLAGSAGAAFVKTNAYNDNFIDVSKSAWYMDNVKDSYELGIMDGNGNGIFNPDGDITIAEAVTISARTHAIYNGKDIPDADGEWYERYVAYAKENAIISADFDDYNRAAKRHEVASLFANALPAEYYNAVNSVKEIPDVPESREYYNDILMLYNAGVVMGSDSFGFFHPESNITRAEIAAVISRAAIPDIRLEKTLDIMTEDNAFQLCIGVSDVSWDVDLRGAAPKLVPEDTLFLGLFDVYEDASTAYIRRFNKTQTGIITADLKVMMRGDGAYIEYRNDKDKPVYRLEIVEDNLCILKSDGNYEKLCGINTMDNTYSIKVVIDLDNCKGTTAVGGVEYETIPLLTDKENTNILNFRFATTDKSTAIVKPLNADIYANYAVFDSFAYTDENTAPYFWTADSGVVVTNGQINLAHNKSITKVFSPVSGSIASEFKFILPVGEVVNYFITSGNKTVLKFESDGAHLYANGEKVYENYVHNLWYRMRFELDTDLQIILVKLNGRKIAEIPFAATTTSINGISVKNLGDTEISIDDFKVFELKEYDDYVPVPVIPEGEEKYTVGLNVCNIWREGTHFGWLSVSQFDEIIPVLGYYDEGNPETADWEIKLMKEHGIDFQGICWYPEVFDSPIKEPKLVSHLHDGYMNAKYSDMMNYCLIYEASAGSKPSSLEQWKDYFVPYLIENYFKDDRYMKIDNRIVFGAFSQGSFVNAIGGTEVAYEALEYLENEVKKLGFDGIIYLWGNDQRMSNIGSDGYAAYSWAHAGHTAAVNIERMTYYAENGYAYHVPTVSVGFNEVPWANKRYPMISKAEYDYTHNWVVSEFLSKYPSEKWHENFVWISTWNEYGEGTYVMPTLNDKKFDYLNVLRKYYTDEGEDESVNVIPTESQRYRINHLYPQYRRRLGREYLKASRFTDEAYFLDYSNASCGTAGVNGSSIVIDENGFYGRSSDNDPMVIVTKFNDTINLDDIAEIRITIKGPVGHPVEIFYTTDKSTSWSQDKSIYFMLTSNEFETYTLNTWGLKDWNGTLTGIRVDPTQYADVEFCIKSIQFLANHDSELLSNKITINNNSFKVEYTPEIINTGDVVMAFDHNLDNFDARLGSFHTWDKENGILTLAFKDHSVVFTVGSEKYVFDGIERDLGFTLKEFDGIPLIPIKKLCDDLGFSFTINENKEIIIETPALNYYKELEKNSIPGVWEFNTPGYTEGWGSNHYRLDVDGDYLKGTYTTHDRDPVIALNKEISLPAKDYNKLEIRLRYSYDGPINEMQFYYVTDKDKNWNEGKCIRISYTSTDSGDNFETYTFNLSKKDEWKDIITHLRFDPYDSYGNVDVDYIRFIYDETLETEEQAEGEN